MENKEGQSGVQSVKWDLEISPKNKFFDINFAEIWRYRDLVILFVKRDFIAQYKQTILGPVWHFIQPLLTTVMFLLVFTRVARIPTDGVPPVLFYLSGISLWNYFSVCLTGTSNTFLTNASIFGKVYFPRIIMPMSVILSNLIRFGIQFLLLFIAIVYYAFNGFPLHITIYWLFIPVILLMMAGIALGLGIIISSLTTKYRDFSVLLTIGMQLMMYGTPVAYPLSYLEKMGVAWVIKLNPLTSLLEAFRFALYGKGAFAAGDILYTFAFMCGVLFGGMILFNRTEKTFMDTV
jgi:lipopolysaccharide transport system permease protein